MKKTGFSMAGRSSRDPGAERVRHGASPGAQDGYGASGDDMHGNITVSGAFALYPMMTVWADEFKKLHPEVTFDVQGGGAGKGMTDTLAGAVDIGMISRKIKPEEEAQGAFWVAVAKDAVFPIVSPKSGARPDSSRRGFPQETFNEIFITGEIKTWGEVIGDPAVTDEIHVLVALIRPVQRINGRCSQEARCRRTSRESASTVSRRMVDTVRKDPLGIGFSNLNSVFRPLEWQTCWTGLWFRRSISTRMEQADAGSTIRTRTAAVKVIADGTYPSPPARFENLATKGKPTGLVLAFIEWILTDGQHYLEQAGYVPLTAEQQAESLAKLK